jgi:quercetin dioxygenase-like cupin family protein
MSVTTIENTAEKNGNAGSGDASRFIVTRAAEAAANAIQLGPNESITALIEAAQTEGAVAAGVVTLRPGGRVPLHVHADEDEVFLLLEGALRATVGDEEHLLTPGTVALLPKGVPHAIAVAGDAPVRFFAVVTPGAFGGFFHDVVARIAAAGPGATAETVNAIKAAAAADYGLSFAAPGGPALPVTGDPARARIIRADEGTAYWSIDHGITFKLTGEETGGALTLGVCDATQGAGVPPHIHHDEDEFFYLLEGEIAAEAAGERVTLHPGDFLLLPKGVAHTWRNEAEETARFVVFTAPGGAFEHMIGEIDALMADPKMAHPSVLFPAIGAVCGRYGVEMLPPLAASVA